MLKNRLGLDGIAMTALLVIALACAPHESTRPATPSPGMPRTTGTHTVVPTGTLETAQPPTRTPTPTIQPPPRPTGVTLLDVDSLEKKDYFFVADAWAWYETPDSFLGKKITFYGFVEGATEIEDEGGRYTVAYVYPDTWRGIYPRVSLVYIGESVPLTRGMWLEIFGVGSGWITQTIRSGEEVIVPLIAAEGYAAYTEKPYEECDPCKQAHPELYE